MRKTVSSFAFGFFGALVAIAGLGAAQSTKASLSTKQILELERCFDATDTFICDGGTLTGTGTADTVAKWTAATTLGDSRITDNGNVITLNSDGTGDDIDLNAADDITIDAGTTGVTDTNITLTAGLTTEDAAQIRLERQASGGVLFLVGRNDNAGGTRERTIVKLDSGISAGASHDFITITGDSTSAGMAGADNHNVVDIDFTQGTTTGSGNVLKGLTVDSLSGASANVTEYGIYIDDSWEAGIRTSALAQVTLAGISPENGTIVYCGTCNPDATCTGSGSGAFAFRVNGAWTCELN